MPGSWAGSWCAARTGLKTNGAATLLLPRRGRDQAADPPGTAASDGLLLSWRTRPTDGRKPSHPFASGGACCAATGRAPPVRGLRLSQGGLRGRVIAANGEHRPGRFVSRRELATGPRRKVARDDGRLPRHAEPAPRTEFPMKGDLPRREPRAARAGGRERDLVRGKLRAARRGPRRCGCSTTARPTRTTTSTWAPPPTRCGRTRWCAARSLLGFDVALRAGLGQPRHADRDPGRQRVPREAAAARPAHAAHALPRVRRRVGRDPARRSSSASASGANGSIPTSPWITAFEAEILETFARAGARAATSSAACARSTGAPPIAPRSPRPRSSTRTIPRQLDLRARSRCGAIPAVRARRGDRPGADRSARVDDHARGRCPRTAA